MSLYKHLTGLLGVIIATFAILPAANAEFLEMPEIEQLREIRKKTLLRDMDIPPVRDRNPDPTSGPRLAVSEFRIQGLVEYPELGITREELGKLVEGIRFDLMAEGKLLESGYTIEELAEVSDLLVEIEEESIERHVTPLDVQKLVWLIREQRGKRGVTLGQIETVANKITQFYRERGFILAKAYIPKQKVRDGIVNLTLLLGMLGEVRVNGEEMYDAEMLKDVFADMMGKPVTNAMVEENLFIINGYPGVTVDGYFEPGFQVGDTRLNINVKSESRYNANVRVDNHGTDESGLYRLYGDIQVNNLLGMADRLQASVLEASSPSNTTYWKLDFETNLFHPRIRLGLASSENQFVVDQSQIAANIDLNGVVEVQALTATYISHRSRTSNSSYSLKYETIKSDLQIGNLPDVGNALDEELTNISLQYNSDFLQEEKRRLHEVNLKYLSGKLDFSRDVTLGNKDSGFDIVTADYSMLTFLRVPFTDSTSRLILRSNAQYSGTNLSSVMRFSLAGPTRARGFSPSLFTADDAIYLGVDWLFNSPDMFDFNIGSINFKQLTKPFVFADYAYGKQYSILESEPDATGQIADVGFGLQFSHGGKFSGNLQFAFPVMDKFSDTSEEPQKENMRVVFDFQYSF